MITFIAYCLSFGDCFVAANPPGAPGLLAMTGVETLSSLPEWRPFLHYRSGDPYFTTFTLIPSLCALNSGAYMHCAVLMPLENLPSCVTNSVYSNTWVPLGR